MTSPNDDLPGAPSSEWRLEEMLRSLASKRRRLALYELREQEVSDLAEIATYIAALEADVPREVVVDEDIDRVKTRFVHADLPILEEAGLVEYDRRSGAIRYSHPPDPFETLLRVCADIEAPSEPKY